MKFPDAYQGIKKIFTAELLSLIGSACMIIFAIFGLVTVAAYQANSADALVAGSIGTIIFGLAGGVLALIGLIFLLIGTKRASIDEPVFNNAFMFIILSLVLTVASTIISSIWATGIWDNVSTTVANIFSVFAMIYIINGIQNLASKLDRPDMVTMGNTYMILMIIVYAIQIIARIIPAFFGANATTSTAAGVLSLVAEIFALVVYIIYLIYLGKAKKMLKES